MYMHAVLPYTIASARTCLLCCAAWSFLCNLFPMAESCYKVMGNCLLYFEESRSKVQSSEVYARIRRLTEWPKKRDFVFYLTFWNSLKFYYLKFQYITFIVITSINHGNKISRSLVFLVKQSRFFCWKALGFS